MPTGDGKDDRHARSDGGGGRKSNPSSLFIDEVAVDGDRDATKDGSGPGITCNRPAAIEGANEAEAQGSRSGHCVSSSRGGGGGGGGGGEMITTEKSSGDGDYGIRSVKFRAASAKATGAPIGGAGVDMGRNGASTATATPRSVTGTAAASTVAGRDGGGVDDTWIGAPLAAASVATTAVHASGARRPIPIPVPTAAAAAPMGAATVSDATLVRGHDKDDDGGGLRGLASLLLSTLRSEGVAELLASPLLWYAVQWARSQNPVFHTSDEEPGDEDGRDAAGQQPRGGTTLRIFLGLLAEAVEAHWNVRSLKRDYAEWRGGEDDGEEGEYEDFDGEDHGWRNRRPHPYMGTVGAPPLPPSPAVRGGAPSTQQPSTGAGGSGSGAPLIGSARCDGAAEKIMYFLTALECVDPALETWARSLHPLLLYLGAGRRLASTDALGGGATMAATASSAGHKTTGAYHYWNVLCKMEWVKFVARAALLSAENLSRWLQCQHGGQLEQGGGGGQRNFDVTCLRRGGTLPPLAGGAPTPYWGQEEEAEMPYHQGRRRHHRRRGNNHHHRQQQHGRHGYYNNENQRYDRRHLRQHQQGRQQHHQQHRHHHQQHQHDRRYDHHNNQHPGGHRRERQHTQQQHRHPQQRQGLHGPPSHPPSGENNRASSPRRRKPSRGHDRTDRGSCTGCPSDHAPDYVGRRTGRRLGAGAGRSGWNSGGNGAAEASPSPSPRRPWQDDDGDGYGYGWKKNPAREQFTVPEAQSYWEGRPPSTTRRGSGRNDRDDAIQKAYRTAVDTSPLAVRPCAANAPSAARPRLRLAIAEVLHIARPLIWTALQTRMMLPDECGGSEGETTTAKAGGGGKCIRHARARILPKMWPWILTLAVDVVSLWLMSTCGVGRNAPVTRASASPPRSTKLASEDHDHEGDEDGDEDVVAEARRRRARLWLYLLRSPAWEWATGPATRVAARLVAGALPLFGLGPAAAGSFLSWLEYWRSNHCVLEGHHHAAANGGDAASTAGLW